MKKLCLLVISGLILVTGIFADATAIAREQINIQYALLRKGHADKLRKHFTDRQKGRVTPANVKKAQKEIRNYTLDDLVASATEGEYQGQRTIKIKMKNGRTLTTLVEIDGKWYADTIWFR